MRSDHRLVARSISLCTRHSACRRVHGGMKCNDPRTKKGSPEGRVGLAPQQVQASTGEAMRPATRGIRATACRIGRNGPSPRYGLHEIVGSTGTYASQWKARARRGRRTRGAFPTRRSHCAELAAISTASCGCYTSGPRHAWHGQMGQIGQPLQSVAVCGPTRSGGRAASRHRTIGSAPHGGDGPGMRCAWQKWSRIARYRPSLVGAMRGVRCLHASSSPAGTPNRFGRGQRHRRPWDDVIQVTMERTNEAPRQLVAQDLALWRHFGHTSLPGRPVAHHKPCRAGEQQKRLPLGRHMPVQSEGWV